MVRLCWFNEFHPTRQYFTSTCVLLLIFLHFSDGYNLEPRLPLFKYGPPGSTFGFSIAQHRTSTDPTSGLADTLLVIGSPTAEALDSQPGTKNPGGVFYCPVTTNPDDCTRVEMDAGGDTKKGIKSNQWLGVSIKSQGPGRMLISCAHRWRQHLNRELDEIERICGKCFLLNVTSEKQITEVPPNDSILFAGFVSSPCSKMQVSAQNDKNKYAFSQAGTSVAFINDEYILASPCNLLEAQYLDYKTRYSYMQAGTSLSIHNDQYLLGAPGTWSWTGAMFEINMPMQSPTELNSFPDYTMHSTPTCHEMANNPSLNKCYKIPLKRDSYMGFSVATSSSVGTDSDEVYYAAGSPRGNNTGAVVMFKKRVDQSGKTILDYLPLETVSGEGIASSFGFSVAFTDVNADGLDDLIVGAPQYYSYTKEGKYGGAVYIYLNQPARGFRQVGSQKLYGPLDSYFGYSVEATGDIDQDGFNDFAVGAPYENGNGTVHIYRGSSSGMVKESQTILGRDFSHVRSSRNGDIVGFGTSLSGNVDSDSNKYPDLIIGTLSNHVALIRSRPIISVVGTLEVRPKRIDLDEKNCESGGKNYTCFTVRVCFKYKARHDEYTEKLPLKYKMTLDSIRQKDQKTSRVHYKAPKGPSTIEETIIIPRTGQQVCPGRNNEIYFRRNVEDKLTKIVIDLEFNLVENNIKREKINDKVFAMINDPILDADLDNVKKSNVTIKNDCGSDKCQSNLQVNASMPPEIIVGRDGGVNLTIHVSNDGEEAHQAYVGITMPGNINYESFESSAPDIQCYDTVKGESAFIRCNLGNPYKAGASDQIVINLGVSDLSADDKEIGVQVTAHTTSENPEMLPIVLQSMVVVEMELSLTALAYPEQVRYKQKEILGESAMKDVTDVGPRVVYTFNIKNEGTQPASGVQLNVRLPHEINNGKWLLYLLSADVSSGGYFAAGSCDSAYINVLQLKASIQPSGLRSKRSAQPQEVKKLALASASGGSFIPSLNLDCSKKTANCINLVCDLDDIKGRSTVSISLQAHVWEATFLEEYKDLDLVKIATYANVTTSQENVRFKGDRTSEKIYTTVDHEYFKGEGGATFPWWYILIGVILVLIVYILIIVFLIKCGFFKRKKYPQPEEYDGDEVSEVKRKEKNEESNL